MSGGAAATLVGATAGPAGLPRRASSPTLHFATPAWPAWLLGRRPCGILRVDAKGQRRPSQSADERRSARLHAGDLGRCSRARPRPSLTLSSAVGANGLKKTWGHAKRRWWGWATGGCRSGRAGAHAQGEGYCPGRPPQGNHKGCPYGRERAPTLRAKGTAPETAPGQPQGLPLREGSGRSRLGRRVPPRETAPGQPRGGCPYGRERAPTLRAKGTAPGRPPQGNHEGCPYGRERAPTPRTKGTAPGDRPRATTRVAPTGGWGAADRLPRLPTL